MDESGSQFKSSSITSSPGAAASLGSRKGGAISNARLAGKWSDPGHPGCKRKIQLAGNKAFITGADEDGKPWKVKGVYSGKGMLIDFTAKGGPKDVLATWNGIGLVFPDGNVWMKS